MELLERYLQAVKKHLPRQRQDDIIAELRANLEAQLEERQAELGRALGPAEEEEWIRGLGAPVRMAAQYQPQQYLIGPALYPVYLYVLRLASMWALIIYTIVSTVTIVVGTASMEAVSQAVFRLPGILIQTAGWVTLVFAAIEYFAVRYPEKCPAIAGFPAKWSPSDLPPMEPPVAAGKKRRSYARAVTEVIFGFVFLAWLLLVPEYPFLMFGPAVAYFHASPFHATAVWMTFYWVVVTLNAFQLAWKCIDLLRGTWQQPDRLLEIVSKTFGLAAVLVLVTAKDGLYLVLKHPEMDRSRYGASIDSFNHGIHQVLLLMSAIVGLQLAWEIGKTIWERSREKGQAY